MFGTRTEVLILKETSFVLLLVFIKSVHNLCTHFQFSVTEIPFLFRMIGLPYIYALLVHTRTHVMFCLEKLAYTRAQIHFSLCLDLLKIPTSRLMNCYTLPGIRIFALQRFAVMCDVRRLHLDACHVVRQAL